MDALDIMAVVLVLNALHELVSGLELLNTFSEVKRCTTVRSAE